MSTDELDESEYVESEFETISMEEDASELDIEDDSDVDDDTSLLDSTTSLEDSALKLEGWLTEEYEELESETWISVELPLSLETDDSDD